MLNRLSQPGIPRMNLFKNMLKNDAMKNKDMKITNTHVLRFYIKYVHSNWHRQAGFKDPEQVPQDQPTGCLALLGMEIKCEVEKVKAEFIE